ncbi:glycosyltransferase family 61 protein [Candidatus Babeliales bacterium]|nr:glycosyltransferase family 61 protein [Candidatus Babeliales bacterium]
MICSNSWFEIIPLQELMQKMPRITYTKCFDAVPFHFQPFSILPAYAHQGTFAESFIVTLPQGIVQSQFGFIFINNYCIKELIWADQSNLLTSAIPIIKNNIQKISGRVAVIAHIAFASYSHWLNEVLGRLALLEMLHFEYDWLYISCDKPFMQETLQLWGIDPKKIISPNSPLFCIQADELIVPCMLTDTDIGFATHVGLYAHPYTLKYVRNKLLTAAQTQQSSTPLNSRVFISRKDAPWRQMINEDAVFNLLKIHGFERYELSKMSVSDQILLFNNAEIVIGEHGTGLVNIMYCKPNTRAIEIFQSLIDSSFWYLANLFDLNYTPIKTIDFAENHMINWPVYLDEYMQAWKTNTYISPKIIAQIIQTL